jgi:hypothetical protein
MAMIKCPECGHQVSDAAPTCPQCGVRIEGRIMRCPDCGEIIFNDQELCPSCHRPIVSASVSNQSAASDLQHTKSAGSANKPAISEPAQPLQPQRPVNTQPAGAPPVGNHNGGTIPPAEPKKKNHTILIISVVIALIIVFTGMYLYKNSIQKNQETEAYENAMESSDAKVLQDYLDLYTGKAEQAHIDSIQSHLDRLKMGDQEWMNACMSGSKSALEEYMKKHPGSIHEQEAKNRIDSLTWTEYTSAGTPEAYQRYIDEIGSNGMHYDEAKQMVDKMNSMKVNADDKQMISSIFKQYFTALGEKDEPGICATISTVMDNFLGKHQATKSDVMNFMNKLFKADINSMTFTVNNDFKIEKAEAGDGVYTYTVNFSVDQNIDRSDASKEKFCSYKVKAKVNADGKISEINMTKIIE